MRNTRWLKLTIALMIACLWVAASGARASEEDAIKRVVPDLPTTPFSPSNAQTLDGNLIPVEQFFPSTRRLACHADTHAGWSESLHRNAARDPFYRESADILLRTRGIEFTRHCESCHTPVALFSGALTRTAAQQEAPFTKLDDEGVTCSVCHSIVDARLDGTGSFTIRRPALLATVEVVVSNRNVAHSFPPEVRDLYEAWVEFEAMDAAGQSIFHSGFLKPDGLLDESAHAYKTIILDDTGQPITRHQIWLTNIKAYDNTIPPGRSDVVRFRFRAPMDAARSSRITLRARVNYRRFNQEYSNYVLFRRDARFAIPIVQMAEAETRIATQRRKDAKTQRAENAEMISAAPLANAPALAARRWNDYGIGLLEQAQYGPAAEAFRRASALDPRNVSLLVNAAIAEMRTERFGPERAQLAKARLLLDQALSLEPSNARARFYKALVLRGEGKTSEAVDLLAPLTIEYPRDREVQRQLGQTLYALGRFAEARAALEAVIAIDPQDAAAYRLLAPIYASEGRPSDAERARSLYTQWRDDPLADSIAARFFSLNPQWADERTSSHTHGNESPGRPTLTGQLAAPVR